MTDEYNKTDMPIEAFEPIRQRVDIQVGLLVSHNKDVYRVAQVLGFDSIIGIDVVSGKSVPLSIKQLQPVMDEVGEYQDVDDIADEDWQIAQARYAAISPLVGIVYLSREEVTRRASEVKVNTATLYRWLQRYKAYGVVAALIPHKRGWKNGHTRIAQDTLNVIEEVINNFYLSKQRPTIQKAVIEVKRLCMLRNIQPPHANTVRARIGKISEKQVLRGRGHKEKAKNKFLPAAGSFPNADYPLSVIQIDHTPVDIILVDDVYRKPIGKPWITLAIDVYSRMIVGYYLSFDAPSETSVANCVAHAMLPKDEWLVLHQIDSNWNVWGVPKTIHVDNGPEFRSHNFQKSCQIYGIHLEFRPVKQPKYGGHIERLLGTLLLEIHDLPGTTFSNVKHRDGYNSEKEAILTLSEFESWLVTLICKVYHMRLHSAIGMSPSKKWEIGIFGNAEVQGRGLPAKLSDQMTVLLDFLPSFSRTIQTFGVSIDSLTYYSDVLRRWINAADPDKRSKKREFIFRRNPKDISSIWFFDPDLKQYFKIPFADQSLPSVSIWEYNQAKAALKREGAKDVNEYQILNAITEMRNKVDKARENSKIARRQAQRRKEHEKNITPANPLQKKKVEQSIVNTTSSGLLSGDLEFDLGDIS